MVLIPTCMWFMRCSLGCSEHVLGASSTLILRRLTCLWPGRMNALNFLLGCGERVRHLAVSVGTDLMIVLLSGNLLSWCVLGWSHGIELTLGSLVPRLHHSLHLEPQKFRTGWDLTNEHKTLQENNPKSVSKETKLKNCRGKVNSYISHQRFWPGYYTLLPLLWLNMMPAAAAAKSLQSCPTPCDPIDGSPPGSPVPGTLQTRTLEWVAISFSNEWKWNVKEKSLSRVRLWCLLLLLLSRFSRVQLCAIP